jgi:hypothetical protein
MPKKAKAAPKAKAKVDKKYGYLPKDLQRVGQYMDRVAFLRSLQKKQAVRQYAHVASQTDGPGSGLSEHGAVGLGRRSVWSRARSRSCRALPEWSRSRRPRPR